MRNIVILISGSGSNMAAIVTAAQREAWEQTLSARVAAVISNVPDASGLDWARARGLDCHAVDHKAYASRSDFDAALLARLQPYDPSLVLLAGFMRILTPGFVNHFAGRLLNIHPSLLPAFTGLDTHQRALDAGCKLAGASVHEVTTELDHGRILAQAAVPVLPTDTQESLRQRVLSQEHLIYPQAIAQWLSQHA